MSTEKENGPFKFSEIVQNDNFCDVAKKFRTYRLNMENTIIKLKEANAVIDQLKNELNISKEIETSLRMQISSAQNRLIILQQTNTKILTVSERIRQNEKASLEIAQKVGQIEEVILKIKQNSQNLFKFTSNELHLMKKCDELKLMLKNKENEISLLKIENQTLTKDKQTIEMQTEHKHKILENDLKQMRQEIINLQEQYEQTLHLYKKQIEDHELTIKEYERERKSFLEDFAMPKTSEVSTDIASADSTILLIPDEGSPKNSKSTENAMDSEERGSQPFPNSAYSQNNLSSYTRRKHASSKSKNKIKPRNSCRQKPELEFLTSNLCQKTSSNGPPPKRRLFSTNCNHYVS